MLGQNPVIAVLAVKDMDAASEFYEGTLGLTRSEMQTGDPNSVLYGSGGSTVLVYATQYAGTNQATAASWAVGDDIEGVIDELKWDGFRGVLENVGGELALWSRNGRPLVRYFPELRPLGELMPPRSALDGEIVIVRDGALDFDSMQMRLHPAESRIRRLSAEIPAEYVVFDVLLWAGEPVWKQPLEQRRKELEKHAKGLRLSPATRDLADA